MNEEFIKEKEILTEICEIKNSLSHIRNSV